VAEASIPVERTFIAMLLVSLIPIAVAIAIATLGGFLIYLFWFGTDWIFI
jgi:hypothetical protein